MKKYSLLFVALVTIALTTLFSLLPLAGKSQADISNLYPTSITPAGFTFSIWSLIYLSWIIAGISQIFQKKESPDSFLLGIFLTALWLIPWHFQWIGASFGMMLLILYCFLTTFFDQEKKSKMLQISSELTLGWILIATIANFHVMLVAYNLYFFPIIFGCFSLFLLMAIQGFFISVKKSYIGAFVALWALFGVILNQENTFIQSSGEIVFATLLILLCIELFHNFQAKTKKKFGFF